MKRAQGEGSGGGAGDGSSSSNKRAGSSSEAERRRRQQQDDFDEDFRAILAEVERDDAGNDAGLINNGQQPRVCSESEDDEMAEASPHRRGDDPGPGADTDGRRDWLSSVGRREPRVGESYQISTLPSPSSPGSSRRRLMRGMIDVEDEHGNGPGGDDGAGGHGVGGNPPRSIVTPQSSRGGS